MSCFELDTKEESPLNEIEASEISQFTHTINVVLISKVSATCTKAHISFVADLTHPPDLITLARFTTLRVVFIQEMISVFTFTTLATYNEKISFLKIRKAGWLASYSYNH